MCDHVIIKLTPPLTPVIKCDHLAYSPPPPVLITRYLNSPLGLFESFTTVGFSKNLGEAIWLSSPTLIYVLHIDPSMKVLLNIVLLNQGWYNNTERFLLRGTSWLKIHIS